MIFLEMWSCGMMMRFLYFSKICSKGRANYELRFYITVETTMIFPKYEQSHQVNIDERIDFPSENSLNLNYNLPRKIPLTLECSSEGNFIENKVAFEQRGKGRESMDGENNTNVRLSFFNYYYW